MNASSALLADLGRRVRALRVQHGLTLAGLAERSGVSTRFLSELEAGRGNISVARLDQVGRALGTSLDVLLSGHAAAPPSDPRAALRQELDGLAEHELEDLLGWLRERRAAAGHTDKIALIGLRGAGKTTVGTRAARRLKVPFVELDRAIETAAGMSLDNVFSIHGEPYYRRLEEEALRDVLRRRGRLVIAAGGGIVTHAESYDLLRGSCFTIWLHAAPEDHWNRVVAQGDQRPMRGKPQAMAELRAILEARRPLYSKAHRRIDTSALGLDATVEAVVRAATDG